MYYLIGLAILVAVLLAARCGLKKRKEKKEEEEKEFHKSEYERYKKMSESLLADVNKAYIKAEQLFNSAQEYEKKAQENNNDKALAIKAVEAIKNAKLFLKEAQNKTAEAKKHMALADEHKKHLGE